MQDSNTQEIPLTQGKMAIVDAADYDWLIQWKWQYHDGYATRSVQVDKKMTQIRMHRLVNNTPAGQHTDHINGDKRDNRRCNLRTATYAENFRNRPPHKGNKSGYKGVSWHKAAKKWYASVTYNKKCYYLGLHKTKEEAARAYNAFCMEKYGDFAYLNDI
jgi:hypothetical protein